jgi:hypothetical protein
MTSHVASEKVQVGYHDNAIEPRDGRWLRGVRGAWTKLLGATAPQEERRERQERSTSASGPTSRPPNHNEPGARTPTGAGKTGSSNTNACAPGRVSTEQENNAPSVRVCEVCRANCCIITRRPAAGRQCLCTVELHVPLDMSDRSVPVHHECASCRDARLAETEQQRKTRIRSSLIAASFLADGLAVSQ